MRIAMKSKDSICPLCGENSRWMHKPSMFSFPVEWCPCAIPVSNFNIDKIAKPDNNTLELFGLTPDMINYK